MSTSMKSKKNDTVISKNTLSILKNFSTINSNLLIKPGNKISTISPAKNLMAEAEVEETFEMEFGIWDLSRFLGVISLFENPTFDFTEKYVSITGANGSVGKYYYSDPKLLTTPTKTVRMPEELVSFTLYQDQMSELMKASSVLQLPHLSFTGTGKDITAILQSMDDPTSNTYTVDILNSDENEDFEASLDMEHLKMLNGDYSITITKGPVCRFQHLSMDLTYWMALKSD